MGFLGFGYSEKKLRDDSVLIEDYINKKLLNKARKVCKRCMKWVRKHFSEIEGAEELNAELQNSWKKIEKLEEELKQEKKAAKLQPKTA